MNKPNPTALLLGTALALYFVAHHRRRSRISHAIGATVPDIPTGNSPEELKARKKILLEFYHRWKQNNPEQKVFNPALDDFIYIKYESLEETPNHAAIKYKSTLAVLQLDRVLATAKPVGKPVPANPKKKNQEKFVKLQIMETTLPDIGKIKLTVGIRRRTNDYVQYCITAI